MRCPRTEDGNHFWVPYVERQPYRRGNECKRCGYREPKLESYVIRHELPCPGCGWNGEDQTAAFGMNREVYCPKCKRKLKEPKSLE